MGIDCPKDQNPTVRDGVVEGCCVYLGGDMHTEVESTRWGGRQEQDMRVVCAHGWWWGDLCRIVAFCKCMGHGPVFEQVS